MDDLNIYVYSSGNTKINNTDFEVVERKGVGHPDTLCDTIAEKISQAYSEYCINKYGVVLRHMVDKIALSGGATKVSFGDGEFIKPIRLYLNCRFTKTYGNDEIPYLNIVKDVARKHFFEVMPLLDFDKWVQIIDNTHFTPGPGVVYNEDGSTQNERQYFFDVPDKQMAQDHNNRLRSNDTSTSVSYAPYSKTEKATILVESTLNSTEFKEKHPYVGSDIKVMAKRVKDNFDITVCIPFISKYTPSQDFYFEKIEYLKLKIESLVRMLSENWKINVFINTRDNPETSDFYVTLVGSAIESGDEGVVGRGNRHNGVIPFTRRMTLEACCGKNPVYHVGKVYTAACSLISKEIFDQLGLESCVYMTSQMGRDLSDPWLVCIEVTSGDVNSEDTDAIDAIARKHISDFSKITSDIVEGTIKLY